MQIKCPECDYRMTIEDFVEPGHTSICSECGAWFETETHLQYDTQSLQEQDTYIVDWQLDP